MGGVIGAFIEMVGGGGIAEGVQFMMMVSIPTAL